MVHRHDALVVMHKDVSIEALARELGALKTFEGAGYITEPHHAGV